MSKLPLFAGAANDPNTVDLLSDSLDDEDLCAPCQLLLVVQLMNDYEQTFACLTPLLGNFEDIQQHEP
jgi:hypothetical protein